jgi:hypothetical protein
LPSPPALSLSRSSPLELPYCPLPLLLPCSSVDGALCSTSLGAPLPGTELILIWARPATVEISEGGGMETPKAMDESGWIHKWLDVWRGYAPPCSAPLELLHCLLPATQSVLGVDGVCSTSLGSPLPGTKWRHAVVCWCCWRRRYVDSVGAGKEDAIEDGWMFLDEVRVRRWKGRDPMKPPPFFLLGRVVLLWP